MKQSESKREARGGGNGRGRDLLGIVRTEGAVVAATKDAGDEITRKDEKGVSEKRERERAREEWSQRLRDVQRH